jgi:hypothetical protein
LLDYYGKTDRLRSINGVGSPDEVFDRLTEVIDAAMGPPQGKSGQNNS